MEINPGKSTDASAALYDAAMRGSTETLQGLIQRDNLILKKIPLSSFTETPLHISVLAGHLDFTRELVHHSPGMAMEGDSSNRTPLHLASAAGHTRIVKALLSANADACLARDEDGRIPLHLAAMRGRVDVIKELVRARPKSVLVKLDDGDTVLHLCVKYNHLEALKVLVEMSSSGKKDIETIISLGDQDGNTILHLASMFKQLETTSYLASLPSMGAAVNALNGLGLTALDSLELCPKDFKSLRIRDLLAQAGGKTAKELSSTHLPPLKSRVTAAGTTTNKKCCKRVKSMWRKFNNFLKYDITWIEDMREAVLIVATLIASMSFQAANSPPGGVWQTDTRSPDQGMGCNMTTDGYCRAGTSVLAYSKPDLLYAFMLLNTAAFGASLCVTLLIIGGFPLKNKFLIWLMTQAMCTALTFITVAFALSALMLTPDGRPDEIVLVVGILLLVWVLFCLLIALLNTLRGVIWIGKKLRKLRVERALACCSREDKSYVV